MIQGVPPYRCLLSGTPPLKVAGGRTVLVIWRCLIAGNLKQDYLANLREIIKSTREILKSTREIHFSQNKLKSTREIGTPIIQL